MSIETILVLIVQYKYVVLIPLIWIIQPVLAIAVGILGRLDLIDIWVAYLVLVVAALVGDCVWYWIGFRYGERFLHKFGRFVGLTPTHVHVAKLVFQKHHAPILVISKMVNGLGLSVAVLFSAGMSKIPFGRFVAFNAIGEIAWSGIMIMVGYFFGTLYVELTDELGRWSLVLLGGMIIVGVVLVGATIQKRFEEYVKSEEGRTIK